MMFDKYSFEVYVDGRSVAIIYATNNYDALRKARGLYGQNAQVEPYMG